MAPAPSLRSSVRRAPARRPGHGRSCPSAPGIQGQRRKRIIPSLPAVSPARAPSPHDSPEATGPLPAPAVPQISLEDRRPGDVLHPMCCHRFGGMMAGQHPQADCGFPQPCGSKLICPQLLSVIVTQLLGRCAAGTVGSPSPTSSAVATGASSARWEFSPYAVTPSQSFAH